MKIALLGYGKMGKAIEKIATQRAHKIILKIDESINSYFFDDVDVAIDFSTPEAACQNIIQALNHNIPVVSGTTGWLRHYNKVVNVCNNKKGAFIYASNFSLGVNILFEINKKLSELMAPYHNYNVSIEEIHHTQKLDKPSGTAITLANTIIEHTHYLDWSLDKSSKEKTLPITSKRIDKTPGTHHVNYSSKIDTLSISHKAHNRSGFALGAVLAAEWLIGKTGVFSMKDVLNIS